VQTFYGQLSYELTNNTFFNYQLSHKLNAKLIISITLRIMKTNYLQCFDADGWASGRASGL